MSDQLKSLLVEMEDMAHSLSAKGDRIQDYARKCREALPPPPPPPGAMTAEAKLRRDRLLVDLSKVRGQHLQLKDAIAEAFQILVHYIDDDLVSGVIGRMLQEAMDSPGPTSSRAPRREPMNREIVENGGG